MFGFLQSPSLPCCGRTSNLWRQHFCGLATRMHQDFGPWSRFLINRDSTFLALAGAASSPTESRLATCCNPLAQPKSIIDTGQAIEYAADITVCALGIKLEDDASDEGWARRIASKVGRASLQPAIDKAIARLNSNGFPTEQVASTILSQNEVESRHPSAWPASEPTALAYGTIFQQIPGAKSSNWQKIGSSLGRLIYWDDAWRDWTKDRKRGRFNPLSQTSAPELQELMNEEFTLFQQTLQTLPDSPQQNTLLQVANATKTWLPISGATPEDSKRIRKQRRRKKENHSWCDCCDCIDCCSCGDCSCDC